MTMTFSVFLLVTFDFEAMLLMSLNSNTNLSAAVF